MLSGQKSNLHNLNYKEKKMKNYELQYIETCNSSYHHYSSRQKELQVYVDGLTTIGQVKDALLNDYYVTDHIEDLDVEGFKSAVEWYFYNVKRTYQSKQKEPLLDEEFEKIVWMPRLGVPETEKEVDDWEVYTFFALVELP